MKSSERPPATRTTARISAGLLRRSVPAQPWQLANSIPMLRPWGMGPYRPTRREFLIGAGGLLVLAPYGCGGEGESGGNGSGGTRTVDSPMGEVELPAEPRRLIALSNEDTDYALVLGVPLAAGGGFRGLVTEDYLGYQREAYPEVLDGLEMVQSEPPNYEQIAAQEPDCILDNGSVYDETRYERLSGIAPTVAYRRYEGEGGPEGQVLAVWREALREVGRAFGREAPAERFIADFGARAEELRGRMAERWGGATFAQIEPYDGGIYVAGTNGDPVLRTLFEDLGAEPAPFLTPAPQDLSLETLPEIDADVLLLSVQPQVQTSPEEGSLKRDSGVVAPVVGSPLWQRVPAVRKDQVYRLDAELLYVSPLCARAFLDYVERTLLG